MVHLILVDTDNRTTHRFKITKMMGMMMGTRKIKKKKTRSLQSYLKRTLERDQKEVRSQRQKKEIGLRKVETR